jgi:hypothetical protein
MDSVEMFEHWTNYILHVRRQYDTRAGSCIITSSGYLQRKYGSSSAMEHYKPIMPRSSSYYAWNGSDLDSVGIFDRF